MLFKDAQFRVQQLVHFQLLFYHALQLAHVIIHVVVHYPHSLNVLHQLAFLGQYLCVFFDCSHVNRQQLVLFLHNGADFLLELDHLVLLLVVVNFVSGFL